MVVLRQRRYVCGNGSRFAVIVVVVVVCVCGSSAVRLRCDRAPLV